MASRLATLAAIAAPLGLLAPLLWPMVGGRVFLGDDLGRFHLPLRHFFAQALADGDDPRWHPGLYCGIDLHGEGQVGMDHPVHRALYGVLPLAPAFHIEVVLGYPLAYVGMIFWLRKLGLGSSPAAYGGFVFAFSTFLTLRYVHMNAVEVIAHLPWLLWRIESLVRPRTTREAAGATAGIAVLTASQGLLGYPQYVGFSALVELSYAAARLGRSRSAWGRLLVAKGLGVLAASAQLWPQAEALAASRRAAPSLGFLGANSLHPLNLLQVVGPTLFRRGHYLGDAVATWPRHESAAYLGAAVPTACAWLWMRRHDLGPWRPLVIWAAALLVAAMLLALGRYSPLFPLYARLPIARIFRAPSRYVVMAQLAASALAALALVDLSRVLARGEALPRRALRPLVAPSIASVGSGLALLAFARLAPGGLRASQIGSFGDVLVGTGVMALPAAVAALGARGWRFAPAALIALAAADSAWFALRPVLIHERPADPRSPRAVGQAPPPGPWGRVVAPWNEETAIGARLVEGYVALRPVRRLDYARPEARRLAGVAWEWSEAAGTWVAAPLIPVPRVRLVSRTVVARDPMAVLGQTDPGAAALVDEPIPLRGGPSGLAGLVLDRPGRILVATKADAPRLLVVSEAHHPGWRVAIDQRPAIPLRADGDFLACLVPAGRHSVEFRFDPAGHRVGRWLSVLGVALIGVLLIVDLSTSAGPGTFLTRAAGEPMAPPPQRRASPPQTSRVSPRLDA